MDPQLDIDLYERSFPQNTEDLLSTQLECSKLPQKVAEMGGEHYVLSMDKDVYRLKAQLSDDAEASLNQMSIRLRYWIERAETAEAQKAVLQLEKDLMERSFRQNMEELLRMKSENSKLQQKVSEMDEELCMFKMNADLDLHEEEMMKIESIISQRISREELVFVLRKALALRNQ